MANPKSIFPILNALYVFETAARELNFTTAAQKLGMAQPSVSRFVSKLEDQLGLQLFLRDHKRLTLTEAGVALFSATELGLGHIRSVIDEFEEHKYGRRLVIACTHGFAHMWVMPRVEHLRKLLPGWNIMLNTSDQPHMGDFNTADIVIRFGDGEWPDMQKKLLFHEEVFPVCAPQILMALDLQPKEVTPVDISALPLLVQDHGEHGWLGWAGWFDAFNLEHRSLPEPHPVPSYHFILQAATEGEGVALAWQHLVEPYLSNGWLVELPNMRVKTTSAYYATYSTNHSQAKKIDQWLRQM